MSARPSSIVRRQPNGERGAVLIFAAVGLVVAIFAAAMAIDVGSVIWRKRDLQVVADLAAADAAQALAALPTFTSADAQLFAEDAADRNGFDFTTAGNDLVAVLGTFDATLDPAFVPVLDPAMAYAVQVTARRQVPYNFVPGSNTVTVEAVASFGGEPTAAFSIGSSLATLDANAPTVLNRVLSRFFNTSTAMNLSLVSYKGLGAATVSMEEITNADASLGSPDQVLAGDVSVKRLATASASALATKGAAGDTAAANAATILGTFASTIDSTLVVDMADLIDVQQPGATAAAQAQFNVFDLLTGSALAADGNNFVNVPGLTLGIPGLASSTLTVSVVEKPQFAAGPARFDSAAGQWVTRARTAQLDINLDTRIVTDTGPGACVLGLCAPPVLAVDLIMPISVSGAEATGSLTRIDCADPISTSEIDVLADTFGGTATTDATLSTKAAGLTVINALPLAQADVPLIGGSETLTFPGPHDGTDLRSTGATGLGLASLLAADLPSRRPGQRRAVPQPGATGDRCHRRPDPRPDLPGIGRVAQPSRRSHPLGRLPKFRGPLGSVMPTGLTAR